MRDLAIPPHLLTGWRSRAAFLKSFPDLWAVSPGEPLALTAHAHLYDARARSRSRSRGRSSSRGRSRGRSASPRALGSLVTREDWAHRVLTVLQDMPEGTAPYEVLRRWVTGTGTCVDVLPKRHRSRGTRRYRSCYA